MALKMEAYKALEGIVGSENISQDPCIINGYMSYPWCDAFFPDLERRMPVEPEAIILPGTTEEVQGILKVCARYKVKTHALGSGWGAWCGPTIPGVVVADMRRMNRIEIDEKNMYAIVDAGVLAGQLQAEAMKKGLDCAITGAGASHSIVASAGAYFGMGPKTASMSHNERNVLGVEWVLPTGEISRLGSLGSGVGWFSGDGPGPSLRGIMRAYFGTCGGLGIFTRLGIKLYPWPGPQKPEITGENPQYRMVMPGNFDLYYPYWEDWDGYTEGMYKICEAEVAYYLWRHIPDFMDWYLTRSNNEFYKLFEKEALPVLRKHRKGFEVIIAAGSRREFEYREKVLMEIVANTGGKFLSFTQEQKEVLLVADIKVSYIARVFRPTGTFTSSFGMEEAIGLNPQTMEAGEKVLSPYVESGLFHDHGPEGFWCGPYESGRYCHSENVVHPDPIDLESRKASLKYTLEAAFCTIGGKGKYGFPMLPNAFALPDQFGPFLGDVHVWMRKVKNMFDPENLSDQSWFISPEPPPPPGPPKSSTR